jgi:hypothetical protein
MTSVMKQPFLERFFSPKFLILKNLERAKGIEPSFRFSSCVIRSLRGEYAMEDNAGQPFGVRISS